MTGPLSPEERRWRLNQLATDWGIGDLPQPGPLTRSSQPGASANDDYLAEELLKRRRLNAPQSQSSQSGSIKRAFTTNKKKTWEPKEIFDALDDHIANAGSPGVAQALIAKLLSVGGSVNMANMKSKTNLLTRRKSVESFERSRLLQKAIDNQQVDMVAVLVPHADPQTRDSSLPLAIRTGNLQITQLLLAHGANASQTTEGQDAFRQMCLIGGQAEMVGLVLASDGRPSASWVSQSMADAARKGCLNTVLRLSRSTADGNYDNAAALREAVAQCRGDITLAILTGLRPPSGAPLNQAFGQLFSHPTVMPNEKLALAEMLLCAGAEGDVVSEALMQAAVTEFFDMVDLLITHGASLEYQDAKVLRTAIAHGRASLVHLLLSDRSVLSPIYASECVECIPKRVGPEDRHALLTLLLRKGATGEQLNDALVHAVEAGDLESIRLLLTPHFPGGRLVERHDLKTGPRGMVYDRHATASTDHKGGLALKAAVMTANMSAVKLILSAKPAMATLAQVFPTLATLPPVNRYEITECFLAAGLTGPCISEALQRAVDELPPRRDERLISLLLRNNADVNFNDGAGIVSAVKNEDITLLETLLQSRPSPRTAAAAVSKAMLSANLPVRLRMVSALVAAGAGTEGTEVSQAMVTVLEQKPTDMSLLDVLLAKGKADVNFNSSAPLILAVWEPSPEVVELLLRAGKPTPETMERALQKLAELPSTLEKGRKMDALLSRTKQKDSVTSLLKTEVQTVLKTSPPEQRVLSVIKSLLKSGADVNGHKADALCRAVAAADTQIADLLLAARPTPVSLAAAMPCALHIVDAMDRLSFTQRLLEAGAPASEANRALIFAVKAYPEDLPLINTLAVRADCTDGEALKWGIKKERSEIVEVVLAKAPLKCPPAVINGVFTEAMALQDREKRRAICELLLRAGASGVVLSDALSTAASDGDLKLGTILVNSGASVEHQEGQAIVEACKAGSDNVVKMLLSSPAKVMMTTLTRAFQASTEVGDLQRRHAVFRLLLERGVSGEVVDAQLVSAARYGDEGMELVRLLLQSGCSPDHNSGEAIWTATRSAFLGSLRMMLGAEEVGGKQVRPSHATMIRSLKASWRLSAAPRHEVIEMLFKAGLPVSDEVHVGLHKAVNDEEPDMGLIRLLLANGASPLTNGCQALSDATQKLLLPVLELFLESDIPQADLSWAFGQAFTAANADSWMSEAGLGVAKCLLGKGAQGDAVSAALVVAIDYYRTEKDDIARRFADAFMDANVDVSYSSGLVLQRAAKSADAALIQKLLEQRPSSEAVSMAFPYIFDLELPEDEALALISLFGEYRDGEQGLDVMFVHPESEPVVIRALSQYPRSTRIVQALVDAGYYFDRMTSARVLPNAEDEEQVSLFFWALLQPQKKISSAVLELLMEIGAKINFETAVSKTTPLMLAVQTKRPDIVRSLIMAGAEVDVADITGNTPLTMATAIGGDIGTPMMTSILAAEPSKNDGSLHNAARELNLRAMQVLVDFGHDPDFPSPLHGGRSALGEICLHAADTPLSAAREKIMEKAMSYLIDNRTDLTLRSDEKSVLLLALESVDPVPTTRALLKVGMWKHINQPFNHFTDGQYTYSPTEYVSRVMPPSDVQEQLLQLLKKNRAASVYYANEGPQPEGAVGLPDELLRAERDRRAREERIALELHDHERALARTNEIARIQNKIMSERAALEEARDKRRREEELEGIRDRAAAEEEISREQIARVRAERAEALAHASRLTAQELDRTRLLAETEIEAASEKQTRMIEYERQANTQRLEDARQMSAVRVRERQDIDRVDKESDARTKVRLAEHKKLVDSQNALAGKLTSAGVNGRRQIGYITGELD